MNREAVALGTPVYTTFAGRLGAVDEALIRRRTAASRSPTPARSMSRKRDRARARSGAIRRDPRSAPRSLLMFRGVGVVGTSPVRHQLRGTKGDTHESFTQSADRARARGHWRPSHSRRDRRRQPRTDGFKTAQPSMLTPVAPGSTVTPLITVGDTLADGYRYESIPDGISFQTSARKTTRSTTQGRPDVDLYVNHETSLVPFPYTPSAPTEANSQNDFDNSQLSHLVLNRETARDPLGRAGDRERRELPALLLELPRRRGERLRQAAPLHERGGNRLGQARGQGVPGHDRRGRRAADRRRRRVRPEERTRASRSGAWAGSTTRTASRCRATAIPSCSRATTRS